MRTLSLEVLLAFKVLTVAPDLRDSDRKIAGALLDHFNRKTGQCDPSLETLANLVGVNRRTVIRAVSRLVSLGLFRKVRHGGNFHRNHYEPVWARFRKAEEDWKRKRSACSGGASRKNKSPLQGPPCPTAGDIGATQTCPINHSDETLSGDAPKIGSQLPSMRIGGNKPTDGQNRRVAQQPALRFRVRTISSRDAAREVAHRRWDSELLDRFRKSPDVYSRMVELIDLPLANAATEAELKRPGAGAQYIIEELGRRGLNDAATTSDGSVEGADT